MSKAVPDICGLCGDCHDAGEGCAPAVVGVYFLPGDYGRLTVLRSAAWPADVAVPLRQVPRR